MKHLTATAPYVYVDDIHMKAHTAGKVFSTLVALGICAAPMFSAAQAVEQSTQLLPLNAGNTCTPVNMTTIVPYMQEEDLHSFDVSVRNASYVAIHAQVGTQSLPFRYMSRFSDGAGAVRHHVDHQATPIGSPLPITLTLLSSTAGGPTCMSVISFSISKTGIIGSPTVTQGTAIADTSSGGAVGGSQATTHRPPTNAPAAPPVNPTPAGTTSSTSTGPVAAPVSGIERVCTGSGALQLWFLLLALYVVVAAIVALIKPPLAQRVVWLPLAIIGVPLVLLLLFWYFAPNCRAAGWVPALSVIVALAALLIAYRDPSSSGVKVIPLPAAKPAGETKTSTKQNTSKEK